MGGKDKRCVLIVGGQFSGNFTARELKNHFHVTVVDAKEFFEYTPGVLRAFVKPAHFDALSFTLQPVFERKMGVKFIWGEVLKVDGEKLTADVRTIFAGNETVHFDYCVFCSGCNFNPLHPKGESLWFPTVHQIGRDASDWAHIDERFIEGRRRHILQEYHMLGDLAKEEASILVVGAGFIGVEWATEMEYYFGALKVTICDFLPQCLGPLPASAAEYCAEYMHATGIEQFYNKKYTSPSVDKEAAGKFYQELNLPAEGPRKEYCCLGVKASNYFMMHDGPGGGSNCLSEKGPGGGKWIHMDRYLRVTEKPTGGAPEGKVWGQGRFFAVGDCNAAAIGSQPDWILPPVPKISYPGEEQAMHVCMNIEILDKRLFGGGCGGKNLHLKQTWWPWGAGMFATSLGPHDACFVVAANPTPKSGFMVNWWIPAALQKELIETTKVAEMKDNCLGVLLWHFVHHTPCNCYGAGPCCPGTCPSAFYCC